jgi:hypothetical protein
MRAGIGVSFLDGEVRFLRNLIEQVPELIINSGGFAAERLSASLLKSGGEPAHNHNCRRGG